MISFSHYAQVYNNVLLSYCGLCDEYLIILSWLREAINFKHPELNITICGNESSLHWLTGEDKVISFKKQEEKKYDWVTMKQFKTHPTNPHPLGKFVEGIDLSGIRKVGDKKQGRVAIVVNGVYPNKKLTDSQVKYAFKLAKESGCQAYILDQPSSLEENVVAVYGAEGPTLWAAARQGKRVAMPSDCLGFPLLQQLRPDVKVLPKA